LPVESGDFRPSPCAGACCRLPLFVASKGQEKGMPMKAIAQCSQFMPAG
jgi:hypothetical protein